MGPEQETKRPSSTPSVQTNLREREAAHHIGVAPKTLANWRCAGRGPRFCRLGRAIVYRLADLDQFVEERLQT